MCTALLKLKSQLMSSLLVLVTRDTHIYTSTHHPADRLILTGRLLLACTMVFTYPLECFVARHSLHSLLLLHGVIAPPPAPPAALSASPTASSSEQEQELEQQLSEDIDDIVLELEGAGAGEEGTGTDTGTGTGEGGEEMTQSQHVVFTLGLWGSSLLLSLVVRDLHLVLALTGAVAASCLAYILPAVLYLRTYRLHLQRALEGFDSGSNHFQPSLARRVRKLRRFLFPCFLLLFGALSLVVGVGTVAYEIAGY
jgi:hypothetical protein